MCVQHVQPDTAERFDRRVRAPGPFLVGFPAPPRHDAQDRQTEMLHLDSPSDRAPHALGHEGAACAEDQADQQPESELLREPDPRGLHREGGMIDDLDLPHRDGLGDPGLLVFGAQLIRDLPRILDPFGQPRLLRDMLQVPRPTGSQVVDRGDAPVEGRDGALDPGLHRAEQLRLGGGNQEIEAGQVRV